MEEIERLILTTGRDSVIRDALSLVLTGVRSERDLTPGIREKLEAFLGERCGRLIVDLRAARESTDGASPRVKNFKANLIGNVLVVTGEATRPETLRQIDALRHRHFFPRYVASGLFGLVHMLFLLSWW